MEQSGLSRREELDFGIVHDHPTYQPISFRLQRESVDVQDLVSWLCSGFYRLILQLVGKATPSSIGTAGLLEAAAAPPPEPPRPQ
jgi:hypothetical protein